MGSRRVIPTKQLAFMSPSSARMKSRCCKKLGDLGDTAMNTRDYDEAISQYSVALSLDPAAPQGLFIKRSKAYISRDLWEDAPNDANKVIEVDPSSPWGYESRHAALHRAGDYENAIDAFEATPLKMPQLSDLEIRNKTRPSAHSPYT